MTYNNKLLMLVYFFTIENYYKNRFCKFISNCELLFVYLFRNFVEFNRLVYIGTMYKI